jgi:hypothetical protein
MALERERRRRAHIRRLIGVENDLATPAWVRRTHREMIESFGTGNGNAR